MGIVGCRVLFKLGIHSLALRFESLYEPSPLLNLLSHKLDGALQHDTFRAALAFKAGYELGKPVKAFPYRLPPLLLCFLLATRN